MAHISKQPLKPEIRAEIERQFIGTLFDSHRATSQSLLRELLTQTEQLMLAKRLAAILMLETESSYHRIYRALGMSVSTSKRLHQQLIGGDFKTLERVLRQKKSRTELLKTVGVIVRVGLPPRRYVRKAHSRT